MACLTDAFSVDARKYNGISSINDNSSNLNHTFSIKPSAWPLEELKAHLTSTGGCAAAVGAVKTKSTAVPVEARTEAAAYFGVFDGTAMYIRTVCMSTWR